MNIPKGPSREGPRAWRGIIAGPNGGTEHDGPLVEPMTWEYIRGGGRNRTAVRGFAGPVESPSLSHPGRVCRGQAADWPVWAAPVRSCRAGPAREKRALNADWYRPRVPPQCSPALSGRVRRKRGEHPHPPSRRPELPGEATVRAAKPQSKGRHHANQRSRTNRSARSM